MLASLFALHNPAFTQSATASGTFTLQGKLTTTSGSAIANGQHAITTNVYAKGSSQVVYTETTNVTTMDGVFSTMIGANGAGGAKLSVDPKMNYELGVSVDGQAELSPKISLGSSVKALTADLAADAKTVAGFGVSTADNAKANTILVLNGNGKIRTSTLDSAVVTSINGTSGAVKFQGGGDLSVNTSGNTVSLAFTGTSGNVNFPFTKSLSLASGSGFSITNTLGASAASFMNAGLGSAVDVQAVTGSAINASSTGSLGGAATINVQNATGSAISATANAAGDAVVMIKNQSAAAGAKLISAVDANGNAVLDVAANGKTTVRSTVGDALDVSTSAAGETALKVNGALKLVGPVGTGMVLLGQTTATVTNVYAKANSIILVTVNGGGGSAVPLQVASQTAGSFVVSTFGTSPLTGSVSFAYIIINQ